MCRQLRSTGGAPAGTGGRLIEEIVIRVAGGAALLIETAAVIIVAFGSAEAFVKLLRVMVTPSATHGERKAIWRRFGVWLLLGLEFELAADIIGSVIRRRGWTSASWGPLR